MRKKCGFTIEKKRVNICHVSQRNCHNLCYFAIIFCSDLKHMISFDEIYNKQVLSPVSSKDAPLSVGYDDIPGRDNNAIGKFFPAEVKPLCLGTSSDKEDRFMGAWLFERNSDKGVNKLIRNAYFHRYHCAANSILSSIWQLVNSRYFHYV